MSKVFVELQYGLMVAAMLFFLYTFRVDKNTPLAWLLRLLVLAQLIEYVILSISFNMRGVTNNLDIYHRKIPEMIALLIFMAIYITSKYRDKRNKS